MWGSAWKRPSIRGSQSSQTFTLHWSVHPKNARSQFFVQHFEKFPYFANPRSKDLWQVTYPSFRKVSMKKKISTSTELAVKSRLPPPKSTRSYKGILYQDIFLKVAILVAHPVDIFLIQDFSLAAVSTYSLFLPRVYFPGTLTTCQTRWLNTCRAISTSYLSYSTHCCFWTNLENYKTVNFICKFIDLSQTWCGPAYSTKNHCIYLIDLVSQSGILFLRISKTPPLQNWDMSLVTCKKKVY